jgi:hypothetical protein
MFLIMMVIGLVGLAMMAIPAFVGHGAPPSTHGHAGAFDHGGAGGHLPAHAPPGHVGAHAVSHAEPTPGAAAQPNPSQELLPAAVGARTGIVRWVPSPRAVFTVLALYGAFANLLVDAFHLAAVLAALIAVFPTLLVERLAVRPLWNLVFRFQGRPSAPLEQLLLSDAVAVVPFRNGRGIVSTNREGRIVQLAARLCDDQVTLPVKVGDRLRIEDIDARNERVTVSVLHRK